MPELRVFLETRRARTGRSDAAATASARTIATRGAQARDTLAEFHTLDQSSRATPDAPMLTLKAACLRALRVSTVKEVTDSFLADGCLDAAALQAAVET